MKSAPFATKPWWQTATALVSVSTTGVITGLSLAHGGAGAPTSPESTAQLHTPLHLMALDKAAAAADASGAAAGSDTQLRSAVVNVAKYWLNLSKTRTPAQMEALIWSKDSTDGADHGDSCAAFASLTLELGSQAVGQQSWVSAGDTYPWPIHDWAVPRVDPNPASPQITSVLTAAEQHGRWQALGDGYQPQPGDWVLFHEHVEVVTGYRNGVLDTIGADSLPDYSVNAHTYTGSLAANGIAGFVNNGSLGTSPASTANDHAASQAGGSQAGSSQTSGSQAGGSQAGGSQAGGSQAGGSQAGGSPVATPQRATAPKASARAAQGQNSQQSGGAAIPGASLQSVTPSTPSAASRPAAQARPARTSRARAKASAAPAAQPSRASSQSSSARSSAQASSAAHPSQPTPSAAIPGLASASSSGSGSGSGAGNRGNSGAGSSAQAAPATIPGLPAAASSAASSGSSGASAGQPAAPKYSKHAPVTPAPPNASQAHQAFINSVAPGAMAAQQRWGVPASVTIAQAIEESDWGSSQLASVNHNLFGIKGDGPAGAAYYPTQEFEGGQWITINAAFRAYRNMAESISDHAELLATSGHYGRAMADRNVPDAFANDLTGVYATDPSYGSNLIATMKLYDLYRYDTAANASASPAAPSHAQPAHQAAASTGTPAAPAPGGADIPGLGMPSGQATTTAHYQAAAPQHTAPQHTVSHPAAEHHTAPQPAAAPAQQVTLDAYTTTAPLHAMPAHPAPQHPAAPHATAAHTAPLHRPASHPGAARAANVARYTTPLAGSAGSAFFTSAKTPIARSEQLYKSVAGQAGISWKLLAACDWMQCQSDPRRSPVHGEKLGTVNQDGSVYGTKSEALAQCATDMITLAHAVYGIDLTVPQPMSVRQLAEVFAAYRWGGLLKKHGVSAMEFPYAVAGLTDNHAKMQWPAIRESNAPDKPGSKFKPAFGAVPVVLSLKYPATV